jgi:hypothetical protein
VARMGEGRGLNVVLVGRPEGRDHWGDRDVDGSIILKWIFRKWEVVVGTGRSWRSEERRVGKECFSLCRSRGGAGD